MRCRSSVPRPSVIRSWRSPTPGRLCVSFSGGASRRPKPAPTPRPPPVPRRSRRERSHVAALTAWTSGQVPEAERLMREHLAAFPRDAMVFQRLYYVYFWLGKFPEMLALTDSLRDRYPGSSFVLGLHAFALEEAGPCAR